MNEVDEDGDAPMVSSLLAQNVHFTFLKTQEDQDAIIRRLQKQLKDAQQSKHCPFLLYLAPDVFFSFCFSVVLLFLSFCFYVTIFTSL